MEWMHFLPSFSSTQLAHNIWGLRRGMSVMNYFDFFPKNFIRVREKKDKKNSFYKTIQIGNKYTLTSQQHGNAEVPVLRHPGRGKS